MLTMIDVANMALDNLGLDIIASVDNDSDEAGVIKRRWRLCLDATLSDADWQFAKRAAPLTKLAESTPTWTYSYAFPDDCLKVRRVITANGRALPGTLPFEVMRSADGTRNVIATDTDGATAEYTSSAIDVSDMPALATNALVWRLSAEISLGLKHKSEEFTRCMQIYQMLAAQARSLDVDERDYPLIGDTATAYTAARNA